MIRFITQFAIQYLIDSQFHHNRAMRNSMQFPRWIQERIKRDVLLQQFLEERLRIEERLSASAIEQSEQLGSQRSAIDADLMTAIRSGCSTARWLAKEKEQKKPTPLSSFAIPLGGLAVATIILGFALFPISRTTIPKESSLVDNTKKSRLKSKPTSESIAAKALWKSSIAMTHRLSDHIDKKTKEVGTGIHAALDQVDQKMMEEAKSLGHEGFQFVTQKVPVSAVRFITTHTMSSTLPNTPE